MKNTELNAIEKIFVKSVHYKLMGDNYELTTINLLKKERKYNRELEEWN